MGPTHLGLLRLDQLREAVDRVDTSFDRLDLLWRCQVHLIDQNLIGEGDLLHRFVHSPFRLDLVQVLLDMLHVDHADNPVDPEIPCHLLVTMEGEAHRSWVGEACGLDQNVVKLVLALGHLMEGFDQVIAHGAAHTSIGHRDDVLIHPAWHSDGNEDQGCMPRGVG